MSLKKYDLLFKEHGLKSVDHDLKLCLKRLVRAVGRVKWEE